MKTYMGTETYKENEELLIYSDHLIHRQNTRDQLIIIFQLHFFISYEYSNSGC